MPHIRTVRGDIAPADLGLTYMHEHLIGQSLTLDDPDLVLDSEEAALTELRYFHQAGGRGMVEMSPADHSRDPLALRRLSEASGVHVVCVTGFIMGKSAQTLLAGKTVEQLYDVIVREVEQGIGDTGVRAGVIKAGSSKDQITVDEERGFRAAARAQRATGALISTHTEAGTMAMEQAELLISEGVAPGRILIGHLDRRMDFDYHLRVLKTGVSIGYDQFSKEKYAPDARRIEFVRRMVEAGYCDQLALSGDLARRSNFPAYGGGPGYTFILWRIFPWLREAGLTADNIEALFIRTPARLLAFG